MNVRCWKYHTEYSGTIHSTEIEGTRFATRENPYSWLSIDDRGWGILIVVDLFFGGKFDERFTGFKSRRIEEGVFREFFMLVILKDKIITHIYCYKSIEKFNLIGKETHSPKKIIIDSNETNVRCWKYQLTLLNSWTPNILGRSTLLRSRERDSPPGRILTRGYWSMIEGEVY